MKWQLRLKPSKIDRGGVGVFTDEVIPLGAHIKLCEWWDGRVRKMVNLKRDDFKMAEIYGVEMRDGKICIPTSFIAMSLCWYLNHSLTPNVRLLKNGNGVSNRDIRAGEELTINYALLDKDVDNSNTLITPKKGDK